MAAGLTDHTWSIKQIFTSQVTPQLLMIMKEAQKLEVFQLSNEGNKSTGGRGRASKHSLLLLKLKEETERRLYPDGLISIPLVLELCYTYTQNVQKKNQ